MSDEYQYCGCSKPSHYKGEMPNCKAAMSFAAKQNSRTATTISPNSHKCTTCGVIFESIDASAAKDVRNAAKVNREGPICHLCGHLEMAYRHAALRNISVTQALQSHLKRKRDYKAGNDQPWPIQDVVSKLCEAAEILLHEKNYDGHGHEEISHAVKVGREWIIMPIMHTCGQCGKKSPDCAPDEGDGGWWCLGCIEAWEKKNQVHWEDGSPLVEKGPS